MKVILCGKCQDVRGLPPDRSFVSCRCGNVSARWIVPFLGTVLVRALDRDMVRVIGIHNHVVEFAFNEPHASNLAWRAKHEAATREAENYLFHTAMRACPVIFVRVGESNDTFWECERCKEPTRFMACDRCGHVHGEALPAAPVTTTEGGS